MDLTGNATRSHPGEVAIKTSSEKKPCIVNGKHLILLKL
jgi:hypothetical protein